VSTGTVEGSTSHDSMTTGCGGAGGAVGLGGFGGGDVGLSVGARVGIKGVWVLVGDDVGEFVWVEVMVRVGLLVGVTVA